MTNVTLKVLTLAAAAIAPGLIAVDPEIVPVKPIDTLKSEERSMIKNLHEIAVYAKETSVEE